MSKEYTVKLKHNIGKTVYIVEKDTFNDKQPIVWVGEVSRVVVTFMTSDNGGAEQIVEYMVKIAGSYTSDQKFYDFQLLTKKEAEKRHKEYCDMLRTFGDAYLKTMLEKAEQLIKVYKK